MAEPDRGAHRALRGLPAGAVLPVPAASRRGGAAGRDDPGEIADGAAWCSGLEHPPALPAGRTGRTDGAGLVRTGQVRCAGGGGGGTGNYILNKDFNDGSITSGGWGSFWTGTTTTENWGEWEIYGGDVASASNFDINTFTNFACESWLVSPSFDLTGTSSPYLVFDNVTRYNGPGLELYISSDYDGTGSGGNPTNWYTYSIDLPEASKTENTRFSIRQNRSQGTDSNSNTDHYGILEVTYENDLTTDLVFVPSEGQMAIINDTQTYSVEGAAGSTYTSGIFANDLTLTLSSANPIIPVAALDPDINVPLIEPYFLVKYLIKAF